VGEVGPGIFLTGQVPCLRKGHGRSATFLCYAGGVPPTPPSIVFTRGWFTPFIFKEMVLWQTEVSFLKMSIFPHNREGGAPHPPVLIFYKGGSPSPPRIGRAGDSPILQELRVMHKVVVLLVISIARHGAL
jgi:hypothetical protein